MDSAPPPSSGFMSSLRLLGDGIFESIQDRIRLLALELQEEKYRLIQIFVWISAVIFTGILAAIFASLTLAYYFWQSGPLTVLGSLTLFYSLSLGAAILRLRHHISRHPKSFAGTLEELESDRACIHNPN
ncbi:MAG: phage holin family protein [Opitutus sp.]|nr:phage holin family protein [Opitutus sp.]MCS6247489.1 phage holin family protein [Opitutus sp.]MCS6273869.1 phage holin family protein [Opitutus sp.]MCS6278245.1 phage holin family protein [Opitutus sp.]MCS6299355.1 phage holin family protein [Opitutus sp.]